MMGGWGGIWQWVVILIIVLIFFGRGKIPGLMGDMAKGIKAFKSGLKEDPEPPKEIDQNAATAATDATAKKDEPAQS